MDRKYWTLLTLAAAEGAFLSPVQLQKSLFLLGKNYPNEVGEFYSFKPYHFGPFDVRVYQDAEEMALEGLVHIDCSLGQRWKEYSCTSSGLNFAKEIQKNMDGTILDYLRRVVTWAREKSFEEIVRAIYKLYPEYQENSVFQEVGR